MFCTNCGKELSDTAKFCTGCGTKVEASPVAEAASVAEASPVAETVPFVEATREEPSKKGKKEKKAKKEKVKKEKTKKSGGKVAAIIIVLVVLLGGGAAAGWYFYGDTLLSQFHMKKAEECFAASEFEDALEYYEKALEKDETLVDAYLKINEIYVNEGKYEDAIAILAEGLEAVEEDTDKSALQSALETTYKEGVLQYTEGKDFDGAFAFLEIAKDNLSQSLYMSEKTSLYMAKADAKAATGDFGSAISIIDKGKEDTADPSFDAKKIAIYIQSADFYMGNEEHDFAIEVLSSAYDSLGDEALLLKLVEVYKGFAQRELGEENYTFARNLLKEGYEKTGDETLLEDIANVFIMNADVYLAEGKYEEAVSVLDYGVSYVDSDTLKNRRAEVLDHIYILCKTSYLNDTVTSMSNYAEDGSDLATYYFDESGQISSYIAYDGKGNIIEEGYPLHNEYVVYTYDDEVLRTVTTYDDAGNSCSEISYEYDANGNIISFVNIGATDSIVISTGVYTYDEQGRLIKEHISLIDEDVDYINECAYDDENNLISYKEIFNGEVTLWEGYEYGEDGLMSANLEYDKKGELVSKSTFAYDEVTNNILQNIIYDAAGNMTDYSEYAYDEEGRMITGIFCSYDLNGNVLWDSSSSYVYNEMGDVVYENHSSVTDGTSSDNTYEYDYNENGDKISVKTYLDGEFTVAYKYSYDYFGNMVEEHIYGSDGTFDNRYVFEYVYDYAE